MKRIFSFFILLLKIALYSFVGLVGIFVVIGLAVTILENDVVPAKPYADRSEYIQVSDSMAPDSPAQFAMQHTRVWQDYSQGSYQDQFQILESNYEAAARHRESREPQSFRLTGYEGLSREEMMRKWQTDYWSWVYQPLIDYDRELLYSLYEMFDRIQAEHQPEYQHFAEIIGSAIQDIPYVLVHDGTCNDYQLTDSTGACINFGCVYHREGKACLPAITFGIQSPLEFCYNLNGDCDTRTVLTTTVLRHYGYEVEILSSNEYAHSILGIALPAQGEFVMHEGKKYYVWELTAPNWQIGMLPPDRNNLAYWYALNTH